MRARLQRRKAKRPCGRARSCWPSAATAAARRAGRPSLPCGATTRTPAGRVFHSADAIDFEALRGQRVGVLGAGASAFDNAACALEAGARVELFARRPHPAAGEQEQVDGLRRLLPRLRGAGRRPQVAHLHLHLRASRCRRRGRRCGAAMRMPASRCTWRRPGPTWRPQADGVLVTTPAGGERFDAVIFGTGFDVDLLERPELARYAGAIDTWARHVSPEQAQRAPGVRALPLSGTRLRVARRGAVARRCAGRPAPVQLGQHLEPRRAGGRHPGLAASARGRLAQAIARDLFVADADRHWARLQALEEPELLPTKWYVPPAERLSARRRRRGRCWFACLTTSAHLGRFACTVALNCSGVS